MVIEFIDDVQRRITCALERLGVSPEVAVMVGSEIVTDLHHTWRGERIFVGTKEKERARIRDEVRRRFNGRNARELAREFEIGRATVYRIIKTAGR
jgi:Mor family transcriptional regulator